MTKYKIFFSLMFLFMVYGSSPSFAGNLDSSAAPSSDITRMYTLEQIYQKVTDGTTPTKQSSGFNEPSSGPTAGTMHTLDNIEAKIAAGTTTAAVSDVLSGKTFITRTAGSGESSVTGTRSSGGLPKTGQTHVYKATDDGDLQKGTARSYTDNGDGTVTNNVTGLMWELKTNDSTIHDWDTTYTWADAFDVFIAALNVSPGFANHTDWRLPNAYELFSIALVEADAITGVKAAGAPYINQTVFGTTTGPTYYTKSTNYWSSTTYPSNTNYALIVSFSSGSGNNRGKTFTGSVRAVRGGQ